ncbi:CHAP domain-containing protein [Nonomuraea sp. NPDC001699]
MTPEMQKYIDLLESQLGYSEKAGAYTKFGDWYGKTVEFDADYSAAPWCDMYLSWAAHKLGFQEWIGQFAWTVRHAEWFKAQGAWGKTPKPGAFVFYDWSGTGKIDNIDHVGIVTRVEGDTIFTIEGNIDGGVAKRKERDTSKVVGYGYPERIKARLDEEAAQKRADEQAAQSARPGDVGTLQLPGDALSSLIPHVEQERTGEVPLAARPKGKADKTAKTTASSPAASPAVPSPSASPATAAAPAPTTAAGRSAQKSKHAKATTADTTAATAEPLPTLVDASSPGSLSTIASPTLVGSALIAALALLALAKTRQQRLRPATASAKTARMRGAATAIAPLSLSPAEGVALSPTAEVAALLGAASPDSGTTGVTVPAPGTRSRRGSHAAPSRQRRRRRPSDPRHEPTHPTSHRSPLASTPPPVSPAPTRTSHFEHPTGRPEPIRTARSEHAAGSPDHFRTARSEHPVGSPEPALAAWFELSAPVPERSPASGGLEGDGDAFEAFTDRTAPPRRLDSASFRPAPDTAPFAPTFDTGPMVAISLPPATSTFSAFSPSPRPGAEVAARTRTTSHAAEASGIGATYRGRRRRSEPVAYAPGPAAFTDEPAPFTADATPRGRRHRRTASAASAAATVGPMAPQSVWSPFQPTGGGTSTVETFVQDAPLRGRRHRTRELVSTPDWGRQPA